MTQMKLLRKQKQTQRHTEETCGCQGWEVRVGEGWWVFGVSKCKLANYYI